MHTKYITKIICSLIVMHQLCQTTFASQYAPNIYYVKPFDDTPFLSNSSLTFSAGFANEAFNKNGDKVPFLQQYGAEDFLLRFINPSLSQDNTESAGQGKISGQYHFKQFRFMYTKNIFHHLFFGAITAIQDISITNIYPEFMNFEYPLSPDQITYLHELQQVLPSSVNQSGMYTTNFYFGYNEKLTDFNHINSFLAMLSVGISSPQSMTNEGTSIFQFPCAANIHFGYPILGSVDVEVNDSFALGFCGLVVPFQPATLTIPINDPTTNNHLLFTDSIRARVDQDPFFSGTIYTAFHHKPSGCTGTLAYSYSQYLHSLITPTGPSQFQTIYAHRSILLSGYSLGSLLVQFDIDRTDEHKKLSPIISIFFSVPVAGAFYQKTYLLGGACNFKITYDF